MSLLKKTLAALLSAILVAVGLAIFMNTGAVKAGDKTYIVDRTGERWDITQAAAIGFKPGGFQYGIGRNAIVPLDASNLKDNTTSPPGNQRVIGVENGTDAHAYVVRKLTRHEVANTHLGDIPIAAAY